jgi:hypothetical protein
MPVSMVRAEAGGPPRVRSTAVSPLQGGYWKGSGSYNNYDGVYRAVCVGLWFTGVNGAVNLSVRCVGTPKGGGYAFSAPSVRCGNSPGYVWTKVEGFKHSGNTDVKTSNRIGAHC